MRRLLAGAAGTAAVLAGEAAGGWPRLALAAAVGVPAAAALVASWRWQR